MTTSTELEAMGNFSGGWTRIVNSGSGDGSGSGRGTGTGTGAGPCPGNRGNCFAENVFMTTSTDLESMGNFSGGWTRIVNSGSGYGSGDGESRELRI